MQESLQYELTGILHATFPPVKVGVSRQRRSFVVLTDTLSPQYILLEAYDTLAQSLEQLPPRTKVKVIFRLEGQLWHPPQGKARYLNKLVAVEIKRITI
ncbi:MAG: DUF3127 domain-containing protein [Bacteroidia bacterium]|nr:DUF3127 domain-containing protein [Bacteroidia bacterium]MDW8236160.1 DUF3127 domain-containing protein [Bacteroidia bacterium]